MKNYSSNHSLQNVMVYIYLQWWWIQGLDGKRIEEDHSHCDFKKSPVSFILICSYYKNKNITTLTEHDLILRFVPVTTALLFYTLCHEYPAAKLLSSGI